MFLSVAGCPTEGPGDSPPRPPGPLPVKPDVSGGRARRLLPSDPEHVESRTSYEETVVPQIPYLRRRAIQLTHNREKAEDLVQETCLRALRSFQQFQTGTNAQAWLSRILKNLFINEWRRAHGRIQVLLDSLEETPPPSHAVPRAEDPFEALSSLEQEAAVEKLLQQIPRCNRVTLKLYSQDYTYREIAQKMGVPAGTVMSRIHRARAQVAKARAGCSPDATARALPSEMKLNSS